MGSNILLINPPHSKAIIREGRCQSPQNMRKTSIPQMTLAYLAGILESDGHVLKVFDCIAMDMNEEEVFIKMNGFTPHIVFINTTTPSINEDILFVREFKKRYPDSFTAVFGTHVTVLHNEIIENNSCVDCVIKSEPEWTAKDLAASIEKGATANGIPGCTIRVEGKIISLERAFNPNLDELGFPAWQYFDLSNYIHPVFNKPYLMINTSRGCVHNCIFCVGRIFYGRKVRYRSVKSIIKELKSHVIKKFGIQFVWFYADDFTRSPDYVKELCRSIIDEKIKITWWTNTRVDKADEEMFTLMKKAGCYLLSIGGESGNGRILKNIKKGTKPEDIKITVGLLRKIGINSLVYFLIGLPGETRQTIQETIDFAKEINPDYVEFYPATPYPGTEFYDIARRENSIIDDSWNSYMCGGDRFVIQIPGIEKNELNKILQKAFREFYFRPAYIKVLLKRIIHPKEFFRLLSFGFGYFRRFF